MVTDLADFELSSDAILVTEVGLNQHEVRASYREKSKGGRKGGREGETKEERKARKRVIGP